MKPTYSELQYLAIDDVDTPRKVLQSILLFATLPAVSVIALMLLVLAGYHWVAVLSNGSTTYEQVKKKLDGYHVDPRNTQEHYSCCTTLLKIFHRCRPLNCCRNKLFKPNETVKRPNKVIYISMHGPLIDQDQNSKMIESLEVSTSRRNEKLRKLSSGLNTER